MTDFVQKHSHHRNTEETMYFAENIVIPFLFLLHMGVANDPHDVNREKCRKEVGLTEDETNEGFIKVELKLGCYIKCLMLDTGVMGEDGIMSPEKLTVEVGQDLHDEAEPTIFTCFEETEDIEDGCEKMYKYFECFKDKNPETFAKLGVFGKPGLDRTY